MKIAKIHRYFDAEGNYHGPEDHKIHVDGEEHDLYDYAKKHGIELPGKKSSKKINKDIEEKDYADLESTFSDGSAEEHGDGDSESTE
tara:strand:- start:322 stop:582 length:261 start_codon:yes stop_codon:yes gene_type:complete